MKFSQSSPATEWRPKVAHGETVGFDPKTNKAPEGAKEMIRRLIFCRPCRGLPRFVVLPTVSPWATFCRASGALTAMILFIALGATAQTTNGLSEKEIQGRQLAQKLLEMWPTENFTNTGALQIRDGAGNRTNFPVGFKVIVTPTNWASIYIAWPTNDWDEGLRVDHANHLPNIYTHFTASVISIFTMPCNITEPFASSDFWLGDLGLDFLHWPGQKILRGDTARGRLCKVLESTNPNPSTNGYSRVLCWIDNETLGIVEAKAYDAKGKLLKEFYPKDFKKVNGQWQVGSMEIDNVQTHSRTWLEFDLKAK
jgi:hypothetical protein